MVPADAGPYRRASGAVSHWCRRRSFTDHFQRATGWSSAGKRHTTLKWKCAGMRAGGHWVLEWLISVPNVSGTLEEPPCRGDPTLRKWRVRGLLWVLEQIVERLVLAYYVTLEPSKHQKRVAHKRYMGGAFSYASHLSRVSCLREGRSYTASRLAEKRCSWPSWAAPSELEPTPSKDTRPPGRLPVSGAR